MNQKRTALTLLSTLFVIWTSTFFISGTATAQNWTALPPYNTLWPLWSPLFSPVGATTGLPTPLVTNLTAGTVLPIQPCLTWDPVVNNPWLLYNTPSGLAYYDPIGGINLWPPKILINQITGFPISITLPAGYTALLPTPAWWILQNIPPANWSYLVAYPTYSSVTPATLTAPTITSLLTGTAILL